MQVIIHSLCQTMRAHLFMCGKHTYTEVERQLSLPCEVYYCDCFRDISNELCVMQFIKLGCCHTKTLQGMILSCTITSLVFSSTNERHLTQRRPLKSTVFNVIWNNFSNIRTAECERWLCLRCASPSPAGVLSLSQELSVARELCFGFVKLFRGRQTGT